MDDLRRLRLFRNKAGMYRIRGSRYGFRISSPRPRATPNARKHFCEPNGKAVSSEPVAREYTRNPRPLPRTLPHATLPVASEPVL